MKQSQAFSQVPADAQRQDDISTLGDAFSFSSFLYVDIAREERLAAIIARWPLLNEFQEERQENSCRY